MEKNGMEKDIYIIKDGKGNIIEYNNNGKLEFDCKYINGERNGKGKNIIAMRKLNLKENI